MLPENLQVVHNKEKKRFEVEINSHVAELTYSLNDETITFIFTGVPAELEGRGVGSLLVKTGLQYAKANNLKIQSLCWFVSGYIKRHPEFQ